MVQRTCNSSKSKQTSRSLFWQVEHQRLSEIYPLRSRNTMDAVLRNTFQLTATDHLRRSLPILLHPRRFHLRRHVNPALRPLLSILFEPGLRSRLGYVL